MKHIGFIIILHIIIIIIIFITIIIIIIVIVIIVTIIFNLSSPFFKCSVSNIFLKYFLPIYIERIWQKC